MNAEPINWNPEGSLSVYGKDEKHIPASKKKFLPCEVADGTGKSKTSHITPANSMLRVLVMTVIFLQ